MLIIIEGADCTGKTTLARALMETDVENGMTYITKGPPVHRNPVREYLWPLSKYIPGDGFHYICDRWHVGEMIYPDIFKRSSIMNGEQFDLIDGIIRNIGGLIVHLHPRFDIVKKRYEERGDKMIKDIDQLWFTYETFSTYTKDIYEGEPNFISLNDVPETNTQMNMMTENIILNARTLEHMTVMGVDIL